jgi:hypothetical protein
MDTTILIGVINLSISSISSLAVVVFFILSKYKSYPMKIILMLCLTDLLFCLNLLFSIIILDDDEIP